MSLEGLYHKEKSLLEFLNSHVDDLCVHLDGDELPESSVASLVSMAKDAADHVPAYNKLLADLGKSKADLEFAQIPVITKENYFKKYSIPERCWNGDIAFVDFLHCSSGSSGHPQLWPRSIQDEVNVTSAFELVFHDAFNAHKLNTLVIICFPLGSWVGGIFTVKCLSYLSLKGYKVALVTPGNKPDDIHQLAVNLGHLYDQVVLAGYPPFVKGVIDSGISKGILWHNYNMKLLLAGEVFSEEWRTLMGKRCGISDPAGGIVSMYGTADAGVIAVETPTSAFIRGWLSQHPEISLELFGKERLPTLCQYNPGVRLLEKDQSNETLLVSALGKFRGAAPLIRYGIGDNGGILSFTKMLDFLAKYGCSVPSNRLQRSLPFVWVFGRSFWAVSVYGANVYVENIMVGLEQPSMESVTTGKFVLFLEEDKDLNKHLAIHVELLPGLTRRKELSDQVAQCVLQELLRLNSEYAYYVPSDRQLPKIYLHTFQAQEYFPIGVKHKYIF